MKTWRGNDATGTVPMASPRVSTRRNRGQMSHLAGQAAEDIVARHYERAGFQIAERRWRGGAGEIDLILRGDGIVVFVEVKKAGDFDTAAASLRPRQMQRICQSAEDFLGREPNGLLSEMRIDVALVDGCGAVRIIENAFAV